MGDSLDDFSLDDLDEDLGAEVVDMPDFQPPVNFQSEVVAHPMITNQAYFDVGQGANVTFNDCFFFNANPQTTASVQARQGGGSSQQALLPPTAASYSENSRSFGASQPSTYPVQSQAVTSPQIRSNYGIVAPPPYDQSYSSAYAPQSPYSGIGRYQSATSPDSQQVSGRKTLERMMADHSFWYGHAEGALLVAPQFHGIFGPTTHEYIWTAFPQSREQLIEAFQMHDFRQRLLLATNQSTPGLPDYKALHQDFVNDDVVEQSGPLVVNSVALTFGGAIPGQKTTTVATATVSMVTPRSKVGLHALGQFDSEASWPETISVPDQPATASTGMISANDTLRTAGLEKVAALPGALVASAAPTAPLKASLSADLPHTKPASSGGAPGAVAPDAAAQMPSRGLCAGINNADEARHALAHPLAKNFKVFTVQGDDMEAVKVKFMQYAEQLHSAIHAVGAISSSHFDDHPHKDHGFQAEVKLEFQKQQENYRKKISSMMQTEQQQINVTANCILAIEAAVKIHEVGIPQALHRQVTDHPNKAANKAILSALQLTCSQRLEAMIEQVKMYKLVSLDVLEGTNLDKFAMHPAAYGKEKIDCLRSNRRRHITDTGKRAARDAETTAASVDDTKPGASGLGQDTVAGGKGKKRKLLKRDEDAGGT
ncbi:hypothetical protein LTR53_003039 [Teratosphaeriaceae sp. CCFEE 6253]|nr:hypothetical protein LTR53_003039 [Teratosphaeriaceae sp. CCFEE 6253]